MDTLQNLKDDMAFIARVSSRINDVLSRTTFDGQQSPRQELLMKQLEEEVVLARSAINHISNEFFSWHNEMVRLARR